MARIWLTKLATTPENYREIADTAKSKPSRIEALLLKNLLAKSSSQSSLSIKPSP
jgi:hypothetical protein